MLRIISKNQIKFHLTIEEQIENVREACRKADAIVIGAGAGL